MDVSIHTSMESWKKQRIIISSNNKPLGRFKISAPCKRHPKHRQSPGVCSVCLCEKLSRLTAGDSSSEVMDSHLGSCSSSSVSSLSSSDASSCASPLLLEGRRSSIGGLGESVLEKSRSAAGGFGFRRRREEGERVKKNEIINGFLSKFWLRKMNKVMRTRSPRDK